MLQNYPYLRSHYDFIQADSYVWNRPFFLEDENNNSVIT